MSVKPITFRFNGRINCEEAQSLSFYAWDYTKGDLKKMRHDFELPRMDFNNLNIDLNVHSLGGIDSLGAKTISKYKISGKQSYQYEIR